MLPTELKKALAERVLGAEMDDYLADPAERESGNHRNGTRPKTVALRIALSVFSALPLDGIYFALIVLPCLITMSWTYLLFNLPNLSNLC